MFLDLGAHDEQLNFKTVFTIGKQGIAKKTLDQDSQNMEPLLDAILEYVAPAPTDVEKPLRMQAFNLTL